MPESVRAAVYHRYGPPEVLTVEDVPRPSASRSTVVVAVSAASVNGAELLARAGRVRAVTALSPGFPKRVGLDFAGTVDVVGAAVTGYRPGDAVWGVVGAALGSAAELVAVDPRRIARAPAGVDLVTAAALPAVGATAITAVHDTARVREGERVLVRGAAGGVGTVAVQLARGLGARVTALAGGRSTDLLHALGAEVVLDHRSIDVSPLGPFDVVLDTVGTDLERFRRLLAAGGRMVTVALDQDHVLRSFGYIAGTARHGSRRVRTFSGRPGHALLARLTALVDDGTVRPVVHATHPLEDVAAAHARLEAGGVTGKVVVAV